MIGRNVGASAVGVVLAIVLVAVVASISAARAGGTASPRLSGLGGSNVAALRSSWNTQQAYDYMGRRPDRTYIRLGLSCAAWFGGWVKDPDPYFKRFGGRRSTWSVELCWDPAATRATAHKP